MRPSNKSRSRNKNRRNNNNNSGGNILNRVYDSAGPDGRVRGTPQQVIEKYQALTHDSSLAGDRVSMENFQQHAEHYVRLINEAQRQIAERREAMEAQLQQRKKNGQENGAADSDDGPKPERAAEKSDNQNNGMDVEDVSEEAALVETPESKPRKQASNGRARKNPAKPKKRDSGNGSPPVAEGDEQPIID